MLEKLLKNQQEMTEDLDLHLDFLCKEVNGILKTLDTRVKMLYTQASQTEEAVKKQEALFQKKSTVHPGTVHRSTVHRSTVHPVLFTRHRSTLFTRRRSILFTRRRSILFIPRRSTLFTQLRFIVVLFIATLFMQLLFITVLFIAVLFTKLLFIPCPKTLLIKPLKDTREIPS